MTSLSLANAETDSDEDNFQVGLYMTNVFSAEEWYDTDVTAAFMSSEEEYMHESRMIFAWIAWLMYQWLTTRIY